MSETAENNRPSILVSDKYAENVCTALASAVAKLRSQFELVKAQVFAASASGDGINKWEKYLGISNRSTFGFAGAVLEHLRAENGFTRSAVEAVIKSVIGSKPYTLAEGVNTVSITFNSQTTDEELALISEKLKRIKPAHLTLNLSIDTSTGVFFAIEDGDVVVIIPDSYSGSFDPDCLNGIEFSLSDAGELCITEPDGYRGPVFSISESDLEVTFDE